MSHLEAAEKRIGKTLEEVNKYLLDSIVRFDSLPPDYKDIESITNGRKRISCHSVFLAALLKSLHKEFNADVFLRKSSYNKAFDKFKKHTDGNDKYYTDSVAKNKAEFEIAPLKQKEMQLESLIKGNTLVLNQVKEVLNSIASLLSNLKGERRDSNMQV